MYDFEDCMDSDTSSSNQLYSENESIEEFVIEDIEDNENLSFDLSVIDWPIVFKVDYILFGTFMSYCRSLQLNRHFLKMTAISPNIRGIGFKYDINLAFNDIKQIKYCSDRKNPLVFIELNHKSNDLIQTAMNLGNNSPDGLRFDVDADGIHLNSILRYFFIFSNVFNCCQT